MSKEKKNIKNENIENEVIKENKKESFVIRMKKNVMVNKTKTIILVVLLFALFIAINFASKILDLPQYDLTENKIYTLSDSSKEVLKNIKTKVNIVTYGFDEGSNFINLVKQYVAANPEYLSYECLTEEENNSKVQKYGLSSGYIVVILETENTYKLIDAKSEFTVYDYTTYTAVDRTEQVITNGIIGLDSNSGTKKVYFLEGHGEYNETMIATTLQSLAAENFEYEFVNLLTTDLEVGDDDLLIILSPETDLTDTELSKLQEMIRKGMNLLYTQDYVLGSLPNFAAILNEYGVTVNNGYIVETDTNYTISESSIFFIPQMSETNNITSEISSDGYYLLLAQAGKLTIKDDETLSNLKVERDDILMTTENAVFTSNINSVDEATTSAEVGEHIIASMLTKTVSSGSEEELTSDLLVVSTGLYATDILLSEDSYTTLSSIGRNRDFFINSISELTDKSNYLKIRKGMDSSTFEPTENQSRIVFMVCFIVPIVIIVLGIIVSKIRKRRK